MNFRIDLPNNEVRDLIDKQNYNRLQLHDQLINLKPNNNILKKFCEGPLDFDPTYKYDKNCEIYDTSQKMRIPAWCDRILFCRDKQFKKELINDKMKGDDTLGSMPIYYNRRES